MSSDPLWCLDEACLASLTPFDNQGALDEHVATQHKEGAVTAVGSSDPAADQADACREQLRIVRRALAELPVDAADPDGETDTLCRTVAELEQDLEYLKLPAHACVSTPEAEVTYTMPEVPKAEPSLESPSAAAPVASVAPTKAGPQTITDAAGSTVDASAGDVINAALVPSLSSAAGSPSPDTPPRAEAAEPPEPTKPKAGTTAPTQVDDSDAQSILLQHVDPFVLKNDVCGKPGCKLAMTKRFTCTKCFGAISYCCEDCVWDDYSDHHFECMHRRCVIMRHEHRVVERRKKRLTSRDFSALLQYLLKEVPRDTLLGNLLFIRMPVDPDERFTTSHPVKQVERKGSIKACATNKCLRAAWQTYARHEQAWRDKSPHVYILAYPADFSFAFLTAVPYAENEQFDSNMRPYVELVPCPCLLHSPPDLPQMQQ
jgi:hypothetical protein